MTALPGYEEYRGIYYIQSSTEPEVFYYVPSQPGPERDPQGRPTLLLLVSDRGAILQLGVRWDADTSALEQLREQLARHLHSAPALIRLRPAWTVERVTLTLRDQDAKQLTTLQTTTSSGYLPFAAIFSVTLTAEQKARVLAALSGREGELVVSYDGSASFQASASSFKSGLNTAQPLQASTDIATWFPAGDGLDHIRITGSSIGTDSSSGEVKQAETRHSLPGPLKVQLGFEPKDAPVLFIQVSLGQTTKTLRAPQFSAETFADADASQSLVAKTAFTTGGKPYETTLPPPALEADGWVLTPANLGLTHITLDATALRSAGTNAVQISVRYLPTSSGDRDERIVRFRFGDWTDSWFVISRSAELAGQLEVEWTETTADGDKLKHAPITTSDPALILGESQPTQTSP